MIIFTPLKREKYVHMDLQYLAMQKYLDGWAQKFQ